MLLLKEEERKELWQRLSDAIEDHIENVKDLPVAPKNDVAEIRSRLSAFDFEKPLSSTAAFDFAVKNLTEFQVHTPHPHYFGLFNPAPTTMGIAADTLVAAFNPQIAAWSHSPFAAEVETHLIKAFADKFGYREPLADGTFCSGGAEANHTALLTALVSHFPSFAVEGLVGFEKQPVLYVSAQSHHSFVKAARFCGLGTNAVRTVETDSEFKMSAEHLAAQIEKDRADGFAPFFIVATAGTTNAGIVDDIQAIAEIAGAENLWLHVDAAWGGGAALVPELLPALNGIELADSITFDAHKWLSAPMGAGIFLTRHPEILGRACGIATSYMPKGAGDLGVTDPFGHSMQWSRRFIGLKVFLSLAVAGWKGYEETIRHQTAMGNHLRDELQANDWRIVNHTPLPVVCFTPSHECSGPYLDAIAHDVVSSGDAWLSTTLLGPDLPVLRACITNYRTQKEDVSYFVSSLNNARESLKISQ